MVSVTMGESGVPTGQGPFCGWCGLGFESSWGWVCTRQELLDSTGGGAGLEPVQGCVFFFRDGPPELRVWPRELGKVHGCTTCLAC